MDAPFYFIDVGWRRVIYCDLLDAERFACDGRPVTFKSVVPVLSFKSVSKVSVLDHSAFGTAAMPPEARPIIV
ncbi:MAG: hypothetical protein FJ398_19595 [Verrucomicrobia bacterium]|nr:hypothetical protein [Verrucomicrobiota bacterium]